MFFYQDKGRKHQVFPVGVRYLRVHRYGGHRKQLDL